MATRPKAILESHDGEEFSPITVAKNVLTDDGQNLQDILSDRKEDMMTPTIENSSSMFKVGQGDNVDYSENVVDGAYESCVLKGRSLVNILKAPIQTLSGGNSGWKRLNPRWTLKANTKYFALYFVNSNTLDGTIKDAFKYGDDQTTWGIDVVPIGGVGVFKRTFTLSSEVTEYNCYTDTSTTGSANVKCVLLEYQEGMEDLDIPYFEGLCDVKSPILSNVGKNLFNINGAWEKCSYSMGIPCITYANPKIDIVSQKEFTITTDASGYNNGFGQYIDIGTLDEITVEATASFSDAKTRFECKILLLQEGEGLPSSVKTGEDKNFTLRTVSVSTSGQRVSINIDTSKFTKMFIMFSGGWKSTMNGSFIFTMKDVYVGDTNQMYEPYKSNTTTFEQKDGKTIVLRSLPNGVCDTLNVKTGEYVQNIGEVVLDGSEDERWAYNIAGSGQGKKCFNLPSELTPHRKRFGYIICDCMPTTNTLDKIGVYNGEGLNILIDSDSNDVGVLKEILTNKPITVQYQLATPIVKQINVEGYPYAYENGHVLLESGSQEQSLTPTIEYSIVANRGGQIRSNQRMVERHQKKLDSLYAMTLVNMIDSQYRQVLMKLKSELGSEVTSWDI